MLDGTTPLSSGVGSMRLRITVLASVVTACAVALAGLLLIRSVEDSQLSGVQDRARESVETVADRLEAGGTWDGALLDLPSVVFIADEAGSCVASNPAGGGFALQCAQGSTGEDTFGGVGTMPLAPRPDRQAPTSADVASAAAPAVVMIEQWADEGTETMTRSVESRRYGALEITALAPADEVARGVASVRRALWILLPGLVGVVALVAWWLTGRTLRPVEAIRLEAEGIRGSSIHRRVPEPASDDEIGRLARTMNAMLDRLDRSAQRQRQFVSDASHELRSPVAAIRTDLEVALREGDQADWPAVARAVLAEEARLETLLGDLLVLAADDESGSLPASSATTVDLYTLAAEEVGRRRRMPVTLEQPPQVELGSLVTVGVASRLQRALSNLIDNACHHAASQVVVVAASHDHRVVLHVDDDGPGIPPDDRERIFERFTRLDDGRGRNHGGAGLGLPVVRSIINRHLGTVSVVDSPLGGARFTIDLPRGPGDAVGD